MTEFKLKDGRYTVRIKKHLRAFVANKKHPATYINGLIDKDFKKETK